MGYWPVVLHVLKNSDVVLLLVDARMPEISRNSEIIRQVESRKKLRLAIVFNKIDLISKKDLEKLRGENKGSYFVTEKKKSSVKELKDYLENLADNWNRNTLRVGIVGYPNVGKSTIINLLVSGAREKVSSVSGTTKKTKWLRTGKIRIMDSPGVIPFGDEKIRIGMTSSKDPHKIKNPERVAFRIIEYLREHGGNVLERFYGVSKDLEEDKLFLEIGRKKKYLVKGGEVDENRTAIKIISDWQSGKIGLK